MKTSTTYHTSILNGLTLSLKGQSGKVSFNKYQCEKKKRQRVMEKMNTKFEEKIHNIRGDFHLIVRIVESNKKNAFDFLRVKLINGCISDRN